MTKTDTVCRLRAWALSSAAASPGDAGQVTPLFVAQGNLLWM